MSVTKKTGTGLKYGYFRITTLREDNIKRKHDVKRFFAALPCFILCILLVGMPTGSAQAQAETRTRDAVEILSELQFTPDSETALWLSVMYSDTAAEIEYYLEQYPDGEYVEIANRKIDHIDAVFMQSLAKMKETDLESYLDSSPEGRYAILVKEKIKALHYHGKFMILTLLISCFVIVLTLTGFLVSDDLASARRGVRGLIFSG